MAFVAMGSTHVTGGVAGENITEGLAVEISASGGHYDLPSVRVAVSGAKNVFVALMPPDYFGRPTPKGMFLRNPITYVTTNDAYWTDNLAEFLIDTGQRGPFYNIGPSLLEAPVIYSGWVVQLHKGGAYTVTSACFVDNASIRAAGATIAVGSNGKWQYSVTNVVGQVREYRDGKLTFVLDQRSA